VVMIVKTFIAWFIVVIINKTRSILPFIFKKSAMRYPRRRLETSAEKIIVVDGGSRQKTRSGLEIREI